MDIASNITVYITQFKFVTLNMLTMAVTVSVATNQFAKVQVTLQKNWQRRHDGVLLDTYYVM